MSMCVIVLTPIPVSVCVSAAINLVDVGQGSALGWLLEADRHLLLAGLRLRLALRGAQGGAWGAARGGGACGRKGRGLKLHLWTQGSGGQSQVSLHKKEDRTEEERCHLGFFGHEVTCFHTCRGQHQHRASHHGVIEKEVREMRPVVVVGVKEGSQAREYTLFQHMEIVQRPMSGPWMTARFVVGGGSDRGEWEENETMGGVRQWTVKVMGMSRQGLFTLKQSICGMECKISHFHVLSKRSSHKTGLHYRSYAAFFTNTYDL